MFGRIAENLNKTMGITRTGEQCCSRFKTVIRRKTSATTQNKKSGNSPSDVPYDEELAKIAALDDSVEPEELRDGYGVVSRRDTGVCPAKKVVIVRQRRRRRRRNLKNLKAHTVLRVVHRQGRQTPQKDKKKTGPRVFPHQDCKI
ncbi:hypothetical protein HPB49_024377 [Dermacentor silvarum]|uniref:Uncharacterized protein n=1 Tax=Dermacentor silvarum TaxID=543639 RepID=A0ACB8DRJ6_DERSI|nr:hypothetical protein HPB49_024377 [Dermacentor silvarum]